MNHVKRKSNIAFFGTPELTIPLLNSLKENNLLPTLLVTTKDMPKGRGLVLTPSPAKLWAIENNIPYLQPEKIDSDFIKKLKEKQFDLFVVVAYGKILPQELIDLPTHGTINIHYSLLPKYRGATPVESAILNGDTETGVCIQKMQFKLDTGPILALENVVIPREITASDLRTMLNEKAKDMLSRVIKEYISGNITPIAQDEHLASYCKKIKKEDGLIDIHDNSIVNYRKFRAYFSWPRTYFFALRKNDTSKKIRVIISSAEFKENQFAITKVIPEGKKEMSFDQFVKIYTY